MESGNSILIAGKVEELVNLREKWGNWEEDFACCWHGPPVHHPRLLDHYIMGHFIILCKVFRKLTENTTTFYFIYFYYI